jgi:hypothetical protein
MPSIKVGPKNRHLALPKDATRVTTGMVHKDCLIANIHVPCWTRPDSDELNTPVEWYDAVCVVPEMGVARG